MTQNSLGSGYQALAEVRGKEANLGQAIAAYGEALRVYTYEAFPVFYARTQDNLGVAYWQLEDLSRAGRAFGEAERVYREQGIVALANRAQARLAALQEQMRRGG